MTPFWKIHLFIHSCKRIKNWSEINKKHMMWMKREKMWKSRKTIKFFSNRWLDKDNIKLLVYFAIFAFSSLGFVYKFSVQYWWKKEIDASSNINATYLHFLCHRFQQNSTFGFSCSFTLLTKFKLKPETNYVTIPAVKCWYYTIRSTQLNWQYIKLYTNDTQPNWKKNRFSAM